MNYYFITGTSRGLGKALAERALKEANTKVIGIGRKSTIFNPNYSHHHIDLLKVDTLEQTLESVFGSLISPEKIVLINNSGMLGEVAYIGNTTAKNITEVLTVNAIAPSIIINSFVKKYNKVKSPKRIINISSGAGRNAYDGWASYCTSKASLDMFSRAVAKEQEIKKTDVKIYSIAPGVIDTEMQSQIRKNTGEEFSNIQRFIDLKNDNGLSTPEEVAEKYWQFLQQEEKHKEVLLDVREF